MYSGYLKGQPLLLKAGGKSLTPVLNSLVLMEQVPLYLSRGTLFIQLTLQYISKNMQLRSVFLIGAALILWLQMCQDLVTGFFALDIN